MTLYEVYLQRKIKPSDRLSQVEYYVSLVLTKQELIEREKFREKHGRKSKPKQLKLEL